MPEQRDDASRSPTVERDPAIKEMVERAYRSPEAPSASSRFASGFTFEVTSDRRDQLERERSAALERLFVAE